MSGANKFVGKDFFSSIEHPLVKLPGGRVNFGRRNLRNDMLVNIAIRKNMGIGMFHDKGGGSDGESVVSGAGRHGVGTGGISEVELGGVSGEGICGVGVGGVIEKGICGVGNLLGGAPLNSNLPIDPHGSSGESSTAYSDGTPHGKGYPPLDILWKSMFPGRPLPAGASTSKLQFHLSSSSTRLTGLPPLHPQPHQLMIGQPKVVYETGSENRDTSGNRS
ncbi:hypothetical protein ACH5RR_029719 [Cinchona calisaya]|uniref:Uncharacterized protein n=1 Tax=Cinchona calisaya TaxID=153742 RepID=A0ABD2YXP4_9GENT